jgi:hypothetical protein
MIVNGTKDPPSDTPYVPFAIIKTETMGVKRRRKVCEVFPRSLGIPDCSQNLFWKSAHRRSKATIMDTMTYASFAVISTSVARDNQQRQIVPEPEFSSFDMSCIQALLAQ